MKVVSVLRPGDAGIKRIEQQFGKKLICVRYRYDEEGDMTIKTVELILDKFKRKSKYKKPLPDEKHYIRIEFKEIDLREKIKKAGGWWNMDKKVWELPYKEIVRLKLKDRIINI
jgi:hypothetical protein